MRPAARWLDLHVNPPIPLSGPVLGPCATSVFIGGLPAARVGDLALGAGPPDAIAEGSNTVKIMGLGAARLGDKTMQGSTILMGLPTVLIGG